jgi:hypothetical protein
MQLSFMQRSRQTRHHPPPVRAMVADPSRVEP